MAAATARTSRAVDGFGNDCDDDDDVYDIGHTLDDGDGSDYNGNGWHGVAVAPCVASARGGIGCHGVVVDKGEGSGRASA